MTMRKRSSPRGKNSDQKVPVTTFQTIILGIVQGLTEFLPISSSGHLVLVPHLLGWDLSKSQDFFVFDVLVQVATLLAVFAYFWSDLIAILRAVVVGLVTRRPFADPLARLGWFIVLATIPAGLVGLLLKNAVESAFSSLLMTAVFLFVTAALLIFAERVGQRNRSIEDMNWKDALIIGAFQALSIFPGVSRSGSTITGAMQRDLNRPDAARFSFLMSIPIMLAAGLLAFLDMLKVPNLDQLLPIYIPGFAVAAVVGYLAIRWLLRFLHNNSLYLFAGYCIFAGMVGLLLSIIGR